MKRHPEMLQLLSVMLPQLLTNMPVWLEAIQNKPSACLPPWLQFILGKTSQFNAAEMVEECQWQTARGRGARGGRGRGPFGPFGAFGPVFGPAFGGRPFGPGFAGACAASDRVVGPGEPGNDSCYRENGRGHQKPRGWTCSNWRAGAGAGAPPNAPLPSARFMGDSTIPDRSHVFPCQTLIKTWVVKNNGAVPWPEGTKVVFKKGDLPSIESEFDVRTNQKVLVDQTVDVSVVVKTPPEPGRRRAMFRLRDPQGNFFGPRLWCDVFVVEEDAVPSSTSYHAVVEEQAVPSSTSYHADAVPPNPRSPIASPLCAGPYMTPPHAPLGPSTSTPPDESVRPLQDISEAVQDLSLNEVRQGRNDVILNDEGENCSEPKILAPDKELYRAELAALDNMGWKNAELNAWLLSQNGGDIQKVCEWLLEKIGAP